MTSLDLAQSHFPTLDLPHSSILQIAIPHMVSMFQSAPVTIYCVMRRLRGFKLSPDEGKYSDYTIQVNEE